MWRGRTVGFFQYLSQAVGKVDTAAMVAWMNTAGKPNTLGGSIKPQKPRETVLVKAITPERDACEIRFPRVEGYRVELPSERLTAKFGDDATLELTPDLVGPSITRNEGIIGEGVDLNLIHTRDLRKSALLFHLTKRLLETRWRDPGEEPKLQSSIWPRSKPKPCPCGRTRPFERPWFCPMPIDTGHDRPGRRLAILETGHSAGGPRVPDRSPVEGPVPGPPGVLGGVRKAIRKDGVQRASSRIAVGAGPGTDLAHPASQL